jgi:hypothetical protein
MSTPEVLGPQPEPTERTSLLPAAPAARGPLVLTTPAVLKERLDTYSECRKILLAWIDSHLIPDVDYHLIHQKIGPRGNKKECPNKDDRLSKSCATCRAKASLSKAGSEQIVGLLHLRPDFRQDTEVYAMLGNPPGTICLICELFTEEGTIVAQGRGARSKDQEYGDVNKALKMAEKSAQIDATLRHAGLSHIFAQDTEDVKKGEKRKDKAEKEKKAAASAPPPPDPAVPLITDEQVADIDTLLRDVGRTEQQLMKHLGYGARLEDIRAADYARVVAEITARRGK